MANPNKAKGTRWESAIAAFLREVLTRLQVWKPRAEGLRDVGDIHVPPFVLQAKDYKDVATALRVGVAGAEEQARNADLPYGAAVLKTRGKGPAEGRVVMSLATFRRALVRLLRAERLLQHHAPDAYADHIAQTEQDI